MEFTSQSLARLFDALPEPVCYVEEGVIVYQNPAFLAVFSPARLRALPPLSSWQDDMIFAFDDRLLQVFQSKQSDDMGLLLFHFLPNEEKPPLSSSAVSSQLRMHLGTLLASTEQLLRRCSPLDDSQAQPRAAQQKSMCRLLRILQQLELCEADFVKEYPKRPFDLVKLCERLWTELLQLMPGDRARLEISLPPGILLLTGSAELLEQLMFALLANALQAAGAAGVVRLSLVLSAGYCSITVKNEGAAIAPEKLGQLFQYTPPTQPFLPGGLGLDLYLARQIARYHDGALSARNCSEGGAEFTLSLPAMAPQVLSLQSPTHNSREEMFSPCRIALSHILPLSAYESLR